MRKLLLVQFNSDMLNENEDQRARDYYDKLYSGVRPGYYRFGPTWEIPKWMAEVAYNFPEADVLFANSMDDIYDQIDDTNCERPDTLAFSALDCNKHLIVDVARHFSGRVYVGGYCGEEYFADCDNVYWCDSIKALCNWFTIGYKPGVDYRHFTGAKTIARLTMSTGCSNRCKFCVVPNEVVELPNGQISQQAGAILSARLNSPLIYIDDKTFGQAETHKWLPAIYCGMKTARQVFDGFIIQTTASQLLKLDDDFLLQSGICYVELGVESYNNEILRAMSKPAREGTIDLAVDKLRRLGIKVIPNIMIGLPGEDQYTYADTINWLYGNMSAISHVNVYTYVNYSESGTVDENRGGDTELDKSFAAAIYNFGMKCLNRGATL